MTSAEVGHLYLLTSTSSALRPHEQPPRQGENTERLVLRREFLTLAEDLFEKHPETELPEWPNLDKLTRPATLDLDPEVPVRVARFTYYHNYGDDGDLLHSDTTSIVAVTTAEEGDVLHHIFAVRRSYTTWDNDPPRVYRTDLRNHQDKAASNFELSGSLGSLRWIAEQLQQS